MRLQVTKAELEQLCEAQEDEAPTHLEIVGLSIWQTMRAIDMAWLAQVAEVAIEIDVGDEDRCVQIRTGEEAPLAIDYDGEVIEV